MTAPRIYININAKNVIVKRLMGDAIEFQASDSDSSSDGNVSGTSSDVSTGTTYSSTDQSEKDTASYEPSEDTASESEEDGEQQPEDDSDDTDDTESVGSTEDGNVDECPVDDNENREESRAVNDTANTPEHQLFEKYNQHDSICTQDEDTMNGHDQGDELFTLLQVCFIHKNNVRTEQYICPERYVNPNIIPRRVHISDAPACLYTVIRDSPCVESLLGIGAQYEIMVGMVDHASRIHTKSIPTFVRVGTSPTQELPPIANVLSTVIYI